MAASKSKNKKRTAEKAESRRKYRALRELTVWCLCLFVVVAALDFWAFADGTKKKNSAAKLADGDEYRDTVALSCGGTELSLMSLSFYFYDSYYGILKSENFVRDYRAFGLDETKPLRASEYTVRRSWFDKLSEDALESAKNTVRYAERARRNGKQPYAADGAEVNAEIARLEALAKEEGLGLDGYLSRRYCPGMTEADARTALAVYKTAEKQYQTDLEELKSCGDDEIESYYNAHRNELDTADCVKYVFSAENGAAAREKAKRFTDCGSSAQFTDLIREDLSAAGYNEKQVNSELLNCSVRLAYGDAGDLAEWAFQPERVGGDTKAWFDGGYCLVGYMVRPGGKYDFPSANVRGLYVSGKLFSDPKQAQKKAEELYKKALGGTEENFIQLVRENSQDPGTASYGGEIADIVPGDLSEEYNDWAFAEGRKPGDVGLVKSGDDYHIFYYVRDGEPCWKVSARNAMTDERVKAHGEKIAKNMTVAVTDGAYDSLPDDLGTDRGGNKNFYFAFYVLFGLTTAALAAAICCMLLTMRARDNCAAGK